MFSWQNKLEHASFGRNETSVELARKTLSTYIVSFLCNTETKNFLYRKKKNIIG